METIPICETAQGVLSLPYHHHLINSLRRKLSFFGILSSTSFNGVKGIPGALCFDFSKSQLIVFGRGSFLITIKTIAVPGARWLITYYSVSRDGSPTLDLPIGCDLISKLVHFGYLSPLLESHGNDLL